MDCDVVKKEQMVIAVCGLKNSGKTTLLVKLVEICSKRGIKTAVIKHDGHDFSCDQPGTDSYRLYQAGAYGTAVYSDYRFFLHKEDDRKTVAELIRQFPEAGIVFLEGNKDSEYAKIEVIRKEISDTPVSNPKGRFLIATDFEPDRFQEPALDINDIEGIFAKIQQQKKGM